MDDVVCFAPVNTFNTNDSPFSKYKEDQRIKVIITHVPESSESSKFLGISCQKIIVVPRSDPSTGKKNDTKLDLRRLLQDPIEKSISCLDDIVLGLTLQVKIKSIKSTQINVEIASNLYGRIHISEYVDSVEELSDSLNPFGMHKIGDILKVKVVGFHDMKTHTHLAITQKSSPSSLVVDLTLRSSDLKLPNFELKSCDSRHPTFESVAVGDIYNSYIQSVNQDSIWVYISPTLLGRSFILECSNSVAILKNLEDNFKCGQMIKCKVISKNEEKKLVDLTFRLDSDLEVGKIVPGIVSNVRLDATSLVVQVSSRMYGRVHLTDSADKFKTNPFAEYNKGDLISCFVLSLDHRNNELDLSLRESKLSSTSKSVFPEINSIEDLSENMMVQGFVKNVSDSGCFVSLNRKLTARVKISELSDSFIKDWKPLFYKGMCVVGKIIKFDIFNLVLMLKPLKSNYLSKNQIQLNRKRFQTWKLERN